MREITVKLPEELIAAGLRLAREKDTTFGDVLRASLSAELKRGSRNAKTPNRADELLLAPLRVLLAVNFAGARNWHDLQSGLKSKGYALREAGGGLALHAYPEGTRMCKASELGYSYATLMRRFGQPFPNHSHRHLADRLLGPAWSAEPDDDDFDLIEPF
ncbi:hypothetical protein [Thalassococcus sp. S3]|uniref:hypothetical protein n=1 Tax=Thalassococcus sp. S3 TaxID=2017482 RepID=UPI0010242A72|nr:hypothetical protein [Thalassococcus sp. S3]QBF29909.1 hypothetical protein CFI11_01575 [Thalassococcus sp. S3]